MARQLQFGVLNATGPRRHRVPGSREGHPPGAGQLQRGGYCSQVLKREWELPGKMGILRAESTALGKHGGVTPTAPLGKLEASS